MDLGLDQHGSPYFLLDSKDDATQFMQEYMKQYGLTDISQFELFELEVPRKGDAEEILGLIETKQECGVAGSEDPDEQVDFTEYYPRR